ncbi:MAG: anti-sigma factor family protein [Acidimicrobiales bacterium]
MKFRLPNPFRWSPAAPSCEEVAEVLQRYLDDQLDLGFADRISAHLDDCRRCGLEAETYRRIKACLASHREPIPEESLERLREFGARLARPGEATGYS